LKAITGVNDKTGTFVVVEILIIGLGSTFSGK
jgi:hypothetical protein